MATRQHLTKLVSVVPFILVVTILNAKATYVCASITPELTGADVATGSGGGVGGGGIGVGGNADALGSAAYEEKRSSWNSLQGSWGKRNGGAAAVNDDIDNWIPILVGGGGGGNGEHASVNALPRDMPLVYLVNAGTLERLARERQLAENNNNNNMNNNYLDSEEDAIEFGDESGNGILNEKRAWKNLNAAWGKRRNAPTWNKFSGAWGKREPSWNNLKGMWGKRSSNWQKLHGGWGKRSALGQFN